MEFLFLFVLLILAAGFIKGYFGESAKPTAGRAKAPASDEPALHWPSRAEFDFDIVGESHYQHALKAIAGDHGDETAFAESVATLVPEDYNPHDDKAVRVDIGGKTVGYLSRDDARSFRRRLSGKKISGRVTTCDAAVVGGWVEDGKRMSYGVKLDIKPFY